MRKICEFTNLNKIIRLMDGIYLDQSLEDKPQS